MVLLSLVSEILPFNPLKFIFSNGFSTLCLDDDIKQVKKKFGFNPDNTFDVPNDVSI